MQSRDARARPHGRQVSPQPPPASLHADSSTLCDRCDAVCCRLTVVLRDTDVVAPELVALGSVGERTMAHRPDGWCVALDSAHRCSIYATRPEACRRFTMAGPYCLAVRVDYANFTRPAIALTLI